MINIPTFIVNLPQDTAKKEHMEKECARVGLTPTFIKAVYGKSLPQEELDAVYTEESAITELGRPLSLGEIGCTLSHLSIYKKMAEEDIPLALILEDDIYFEEDFTDTLNVISSQWKTNWEIILLGHHPGFHRADNTLQSYWGKQQLSPKRALSHPIETAYGTYGYILSKEAAQKLISATQPLVLPIDHITGTQKVLRPLIVSPPIIQYNTEDFEKNSHIHEEREALSSLQTSGKTEKNIFVRKVRGLANRALIFYRQIRPIK